MWDVKEIFYTQQQVMDRVKLYRKYNDNPSWKEIAEESDLTYTYLIAWKNKNLTMGQEGLGRLVEFLESRGY